MRLPAIPLHPHIIQVALAHLSDGARFVSHQVCTVDLLLTYYSVTAVQIKNAELIAHCVYRKMTAFDMVSANHRYEILRTDFSALY